MKDFIARRGESSGTSTEKRMAKNASNTSKQPVARPRVNWKREEHERVRQLWHVAAMSLGVAPDMAAVGQARSDMKFAEAYEARKRLLGRKLSVEPVDGHVTFFPDHPYNKGKTGTQNSMVDVVSCLDILESARLKVPKQLAGMRPKLEAQGLPKHSQIHVGLAAFHALANEVGKKPVKDQSSRNSSVEIDNLHALILAMAIGAYNYKLDVRPSDNADAVDSILKDIQAAGLASYGLSTSAAIQKKLVEAASRRSVKG